MFTVFSRMFRICFKKESAVKPYIIFFKFLTILASSPIEAKSIIRQKDGIELDWSRLKIRFNSKSLSDPSQPKETQTFEAQQQQAITAALLKAQEYVKTAHSEELKKIGIPESQIELSATKASQIVGATSYVFHTQIYKNQGVEVFLENSLAKTFAYFEHGPAGFNSSSAVGAGSNQLGAESNFSGVILRTKELVEPRAHYEIVDETGKLLFSQKDVKKDSYFQNLMGKWLESPTRMELSSIVGVKPVSIEFKEDNKKRFVVQGKVWNQIFNTTKDLFTQAKIVLATHQTEEADILKDSSL